MMPALFDDAAAGGDWPFHARRHGRVRQFLLPDFSMLTGQGVLDALGWPSSPSIGLGVHTTYGAYLPSSEGVLRPAFGL